MVVTRSALIGRHAERDRLQEALKSAERGSGSVVLLAGEAGVGKTRLADEVADGSGGAVLRGAAVQGAGTPYGPIVAALRSYLRANPDGLDDCGPLRAHLALVLPELGEPAPATDRATLFEAVRGALANVVREEHAVLILDDLQWSDDATLELLSALAEPLGELPLLVLAAYRSDGLPRDHLLRRIRHELRRGGGPRAPLVGAPPTGEDAGRRGGGLAGAGP